MGLLQPWLPPLQILISPSSTIIDSIILEPALLSVPNAMELSLGFRRLRHALVSPKLSLVMWVVFPKHALPFHMYGLLLLETFMLLLEWGCFTV
jgi:uncharacterized membrane protein YhaH (DUF805 family)